MWEVNHKEGRALKHWWFQTVVLEKTLESPLDCKKIKPVNPKGNQSWIFIGRTGAEVEVPVFWPPEAKSQLTLMLRKIEGRKEKRETGDEMVGWHHRCNRHELEQTLGDGAGQEGLATICGVAKSWTWLGNWTTTATIERNKTPYLHPHGAMPRPRHGKILAFFVHDIK